MQYKWIQLQHEAVLRGKKSMQFYNKTQDINDGAPMGKWNL
jgi:hypothetical protein